MHRVTEGRTDHFMISIADHTVLQHDRLKGRENNKNFDNVE